MDRKKKNTLLLIGVLAVVLGAAAFVLYGPKESGNTENSGAENNILENGGADNDENSDNGNTGHGDNNNDSSQKGIIAVIQQEGQVLMEIPLDEDRDFVVQHPSGGFNSILVKDGKICVTDADCPDLICVRTGNAWEEGQVIACLPHRLIIYIDYKK